MNTYRTLPIPGTILFVPSRQQIEALKVGDLAPNAFGEMRVVTEIFGRGDDINGKAYVCYYTEYGKPCVQGMSGSMSQSMKEDEILCHVAIGLKSEGIYRFQKRITEAKEDFVFEDRSFKEFDRISELR